MNSENRIINYVITRLRDEECGEVLIHDLEIMGKLLDELPNYQQHFVLDAFCGKEAPDAE